MNGVLAQAGAVLFDFQLFAPRFALDGIVVVARLLAHEKHGLCLFLALTGHGVDSAGNDRKTGALRDQSPFVVRGRESNRQPRRSTEREGLRRGTTGTVKLLV